MVPLLIGLGVAGNLFQGFSAKKKQRSAQRQQAQYESQLKAAEANRQAIIDPYSGIKDLSGMISNPFANLQVATQAAEMQASEQDISLAATLDTLRATGQAAGGATALAQAAARSKQDISASIEMQEAENARLRAQGEQQMQQMRMSEATRLQEADVAGKQFMFGVREDREMQKLDRLQSMADRQANQAMAYQQASASAFGSAFGSLVSLGTELD